MTLSSSTSVWKAFQLFQPIGGVLAAPASWPSQTPRATGPGAGTGLAAATTGRARASATLAAAR